MTDLKARSAAVLKGAMKGTRTASLAAALMPLGAVAVNQAQGMTASHMEAPSPTFDGTHWNYSFTIFNDSFSDEYADAVLSSNLIDEEPDAEPVFGFNLVDWELPLYDNTDLNDDIVSMVTLPDGWAVEVIVGAGNSSSVPGLTEAYGDYNWADGYDPNQDPDHGVNYNGNDFLDPSYVLHFYSTFDADGDPFNPVAEGGFLGGFGFKSIYDGTASPYLASFIFEPQAVGDPPTPLAGFAPNTPSHPASQQAVVPEPMTAGLVAMSGMALLAGLKRRRD